MADRATTLTLCNIMSFLHVLELILGRPPVHGARTRLVMRAISTFVQELCVIYVVGRTCLGSCGVGPRWQRTELAWSRARERP
jgi:hypothetical protein